MLNESREEFAHECLLRLSFLSHRLQAFSDGLKALNSMGATIDPATWSLFFGTFPWLRDNPTTTLQKEMDNQRG